jgi:hypothetical protein
VRPSVSSRGTCALVFFFTLTTPTRTLRASFFRRRREPPYKQHAVHRSQRGVT